MNKTFQVEKYNEELNVWNEKVLIIKTGAISFTEKNPALSFKTVTYSLDKAVALKHKSHLINGVKKNYVISINFSSLSTTAEGIYISLLTEKLLNACYEKITNSIPLNSPKSTENISFSEEYDSDSKTNLDSLFEMSIKKTADGFKTTPITQLNIDQPIRKKISVEDKSERYLHFDLDIEDDDEPKNNSGIFSKSEQNSPLNFFNLSSSPKEKINAIINQIENYSLFIYDSYLFKKIIKENNLSKHEIGILYSSLPYHSLQKQLLTEMIARISKSHLKRKFRETKVFSDEIIITHFNQYLGSNTMNSDLFSKILPGELNDVFGINVILDLRSQISLHNLFIMMQYHTKIYFNDIKNINLENESPFTEQDIKYISPYLISKTIMKDDENESITLTSLKRIPNYTLTPSQTSLKEFNSNFDLTRIELISTIYTYLSSKKYEIALRLCDYYITKFSDTFFLNAIVYIIMAEIYNSLGQTEEVDNYFQKSLEDLLWIYEDENECNLLCDVYYSYSLILMKQGEDYIRGEFEEISKIFDKSLELGKNFYETANREKYIKIKLNWSIFQYVYKNSLSEDLIEDIKEAIGICKEEGEMFARIFLCAMERMRDKRNISKIKKALIEIS